MFEDYSPTAVPEMRDALRDDLDGSGLPRIR
ncbi:MAG: hypothetical protein RLY31_1868 [Bacteroidota bacterium]|jgi:hypothetical protein